MHIQTFHHLPADAGCVFECLGGEVCMSEDEGEGERELVGTPCPVPNCQGFVKYDDEKDEYFCDFGHILGWKR